MRKIMVSLLLVMSMSVPVFAQDTAEAPTQEVATLEATQTADVVTATPSPTPDVTATPEPTPVPPPVVVTPIDQSLVVPQLLIIGIVVLGAFVTIAWVGIKEAAKGLPQWSLPLVLSNLKSGVDTLDNLTDGPVSDAGITLLRQKIAELERELNAVKAQVTTNAADIQTTNRAVSQVISNG